MHFSCHLTALYGDYVLVPERADRGNAGRRILYGFCVDIARLKRSYKSHDSRRTWHGGEDVVDELLKRRLVSGAYHNLLQMIINV